MAPVSAILHSWGIRMHRYLDDWLVQSSSRESLLQDLQVVLDLCRELGIVINPEKSNLEPSQVVQYLGVIINAQTFVASPSPEHITRLQSTTGEFLSSAAPPASVWLSLLGMLSSMSHLVPGGWLRMRSLQLCLHQSWDWVDQSTQIPWSPDCLRDLRWCSTFPSISGGVSPSGVSRPGLLVLRLGRRLGGTLGPSHCFRPLEQRRSSSLHQRQGTFRRTSWSPPLPVISSGEDNRSVLRRQHDSCLPSQGGGHTVSLPELFGARDPPLVGVTRIRLAPQYIPGSLNVLADTLSRPHQLPHTEWSLNQDVFQFLRRRWPVQIDLFATSEIAAARSFDLPSGTL